MTVNTLYYTFARNYFRRYTLKVDVIPRSSSAFIAHYPDQAFNVTSTIIRVLTANNITPLCTSVELAYG